MTHAPERLDQSKATDFGEPRDLFADNQDFFFEFLQAAEHRHFARHLSGLIVITIEALSLDWTEGRDATDAAPSTAETMDRLLKLKLLARFLGEPDAVHLQDLDFPRPEPLDPPLGVRLGAERPLGPGFEQAFHERVREALHCREPRR